MKYKYKEPESWAELLYKIQRPVPNSPICTEFRELVLRLDPKNITEGLKKNANTKFYDTSIWINIVDWWYDAAQELNMGWSSTAYYRRYAGPSKRNTRELISFLKRLLTLAERKKLQPR